MDEQRALLDQLMGTTRDLSEIQKGRVHKIRFSDHDVCKNYLCGLCPHVAFAATKSDMGKCSKRICNTIEADACKDEWNALSSHDKDRYGYERDLLHCLENIVKLCDRKIDKQRQRTDQDLLISEDDVMKIFSLHKQISDCIHQCEECVKEGHIDRIYDLVKQVSQLQESANKIANLPDEKRNLVCETSGNYMSSRDNDERMRAHFEGKQFIGWKLVREKLSALKSDQKSGAARSHGAATSSRGERRDSGGSYRDRDRDRDRSRERDRDRSRDRGERGRDRERVRGRDRNGEIRRDLDRARDRSPIKYDDERRDDRKHRDMNKDPSSKRSFGETKDSSREEGEEFE